MRCHLVVRGNAPESFLIAGCLRVKNIPSTIAARFKKMIRKFWKWLTVIDPARINRLMPSPSPKPVHISELRIKLMLCPDCERKVSTSAMNCPHCGRKLKQGAVGVMAAIIIGLLIACLVFLTIVLARYASRLDVLTDSLVALQRSNQPPSLTPEQSPTPTAAPIPRAIPIATPNLTPSPRPRRHR
jgi:hypothetical protein